MYTYINNLQPYFFSIRQINGNFSLDIKIPITWKFDNIVSPYKSIATLQQDKNQAFVLLSLVTEANEDGLNLLYVCAEEIIKYNKDIEEKEKLFKQKVKELEELFKNESLDKLKEINLTVANGQEINTSSGISKQRDGEGQEGDRSREIKNDKRDKKNRQEKNFSETERKEETITLE